MDPLEIFPYEPRWDQKKVIKKLHNYASEGKRILFQAPTGYGKTPVILAALLPLSDELDIPIIWAVRTGGETDRVIEELKEFVVRSEIYSFGLSFRGKRDMCLLARDMNIGDFESVTELCKRIRKRCKYYINLPSEFKDFDRPLLFSEIYEDAKVRGYCPYYFQFRLLNNAELVAFSYNYVFSDYLYWPIKRYLMKYGAFLVIDEAHNIDKAVMNLFSLKISLGTIKRAINEVKSLDEKKHKGIISVLLDIERHLKREADKLIDEDDLFDPLELLESCNVDGETINSFDRLGNLVIAKKLEELKAPRSSLRRLAFFLETLMNSIDNDGLAFVKYRNNSNTYFEIWDMRIADHLIDKWEEYESIIFTSGTLKPYDAFAEVIGLSNLSVVEGEFEVPRENALSVIMKGLSTRGEELSHEMISKYNDLLENVIQWVNRNIAIFFASYRILNYFEKMLIDISQRFDRDLIIEKQNMTGELVRKNFEKFIKSNKGVLAGVAGGKFSEGLDYPGSILETIILVGIPFDRMTKRTKVYIEYFSDLYGEEKGRYYAYIVPALRRASQAMGRAIRSPNDRAFIIAADERYLYPRYFSLLPDFFKKTFTVIKSVRGLKRLVNEFF